MTYLSRISQICEALCKEEKIILKIGKFIWRKKQVSLTTKSLTRRILHSKKKILLAINVLYRR
jgi:hypothetical protein